MIAKSIRMDQQTTDGSVSNINLSTSAEARFQPSNVISLSESSQTGSNEKKEENFSVESVFLESGSDKVQASDQKKAKRTNSKKKYDNIPNDIRIKLLDAVENKGEKIKHVAKRLAINYSSAKSICQVFKKEGRTKKMLIKKRMIPTESSVVKQKPGPIIPVFDQQQEANHTINQQIYKRDFEESNDATDTLTKLRNKLLQGRNNTSGEREDFPPYKKLHQSYDGTVELISNEATSLQELDRVIAQNNQILNPRGGGGASANLQNNTNSISGLNNTQMIGTAPNVNVYQKQVFQTQKNEMTENQFGGYVIANPQNVNMMQQTPGQQQVFVAPYGNQMQLAMNPFQNASNYPQQPGFVTFGMPPQQQYGNNMVMMMNAPNQSTNQPYYMAPIDGNVPQQQQQVPIIMQSPQFLSMGPNSQQVNGYPQPQAQQNGGYTLLQPQQIAGYTQPQQIAGYTQPQQIAGYNQPQQPVMYVLPTGASTVGQNFPGVQSYVYPNANAQISPVQITNNIQQTSIPVVAPENHFAQSNEGNTSGTVRPTSDLISIINPVSKVVVKTDSFDPSSNTKKVVFNSIPKPRLVSDLLNELKTNSSSNISVRWHGLKGLAQREKPE